MKKIKKFIINLSRNDKIVKIEILTFIMFILISCLICYSIFFKQFGINLWILCLIVLAIVEMLATFSKYDANIIMKNNFLYIILSDDKPMWWILTFGLLSIFRYFLRFLLINTVINIIVTVIVFILSDKLTKCINKYFKEKIEDSTSN